MEIILLLSWSSFLIRRNIFIFGKKNLTAKTTYIARFKHNGFTIVVHRAKKIYFFSTNEGLNDPV